MKDTHLYFLTKYKQLFSLKCDIYNVYTLLSPFNMNRIKKSILFIKYKKNCEKRCGGSSVNGICFNKIKLLKLLPSCKSVHPLCYGHKSSTGTVRCLFHRKSYDSTAPVRRPAGGRKNRFEHFLRHRTVPGEV